MEAAQSAEVGTWWGQPLAYMVSGLQQGNLLVCLARVFLREKLMNGALVSNLPQVSAGDRRHKLQPGAPGARRAGEAKQGGHPQPTALPGPQPTSQCSCCPHPRALDFPHSGTPPLQLSPRLPASLG